MIRDVGPLSIFIDLVTCSNCLHFSSAKAVIKCQATILLRHLINFTYPSEKPWVEVIHTHILSRPRTLTLVAINELSISNRQNNWHTENYVFYILRSIDILDSSQLFLWRSLNTSTDFCITWALTFFSVEDLRASLHSLLVGTWEYQSWSYRKWASSLPARLRPSTSWIAWKSPA